MMPDNPREKKRWPWWAKLLLPLAPVFILLVVIMVIEAGGRQAYKKALQEARGIGGPVTIQEIEAARKTWPDEKNGALIILSLSGKLAPAPEDEDSKLLPIVGQAVLPPLGEKWPPEVDRAVADYLGRMSDPLTSIDRLLNCEGGRFPLPITRDPMDMLLPDRKDLRNSARLKSLQAAFRAMRGDTTSLVQDIRIMRRHARLVEDEPTLISALVAIGLDSLTLHTIERALAVADLDSGQLAQLDREVLPMTNEYRLGWALRGERAYWMRLTDYFRDSGARVPAYNPRLSLPMSVPGMSGVFLQDMSLGLGFHNRLVQVQDSRQGLEVVAAISADLNAAPSRYALTRMFFSSPERVFLQDLRLTAQARCMRILLAIERYRLKTGRLPARLDELVPAYLDAIPLDPFDDKPMRDRVDPDGVVVYSIGEDKVDDGGKVQSRMPPKTKLADFGFVLLKPEFRGRPPTTTAPATQATRPAELFAPAGG